MLFIDNHSSFFNVVIDDSVLLLGIVRIVEAYNLVIDLWLVELQLLYHHFVMAFSLPLFIIDILINLIADLVHSLV